MTPISALAKSAQARSLWQLAADYDRWGLAPEAEVARMKYRKLLIAALAEDAQASVCDDGSTDETKALG